MPKFQDRVGSTTIKQYSVPIDRDKDALQSECDDIDAALALTDPVIDSIIATGAMGFGSAQTFRDDLTERKQKIAAQIRLWDLDTTTLSFEDLQPTLLRFEASAYLKGAVESFCGEEVGSEATKVLAAGGKWAHLFDESHSITLDFGNKEQIDAVGVQIDSGANNSHKLRGVDVYASAKLAGIIDPENQVLTGVDFATLDDSNLQVFPGGKKRARYVRFENITTDDASNKIRVKYFTARVLPKFFGEG